MLCVSEAWRWGARLRNHDSTKTGEWLPRTHLEGGPVEPVLGGFQRFIPLILLGARTQ